jgi:hypothetical protein
MKNIRSNRKIFSALPLLALCLCATISQAQNMIMKDLTPGPFTAAPSPSKIDMVFDRDCNVVQSPDTPSSEDMGGFFPAEAVSIYYQNVLHKKLDTSDAKVTVLKGPLHGKLVEITKEEALKRVSSLSSSLFSYMANPGYLGADKATLLIEIAGKRYKVHTKFYVVTEKNDNNWYEKGTPATLCAQSQPRRISSLTFDQQVGLAEFDNIVEEIASTPLVRKYDQFILASGMVLAFADLPGGSARLGQ